MHFSCTHTTKEKQEKKNKVYLQQLGGCPLCSLHQQRLLLERLASDLMAPPNLLDQCIPLNSVSLDPIIDNVFEDATVFQIMPMSLVVQAVFVSIAIYPFRSSRQEVDCLGFHHFYKHIYQRDRNRRIAGAFRSFWLLLRSCMMVVAPTVAISFGVVAILPLLPDLGMIYWLGVVFCFLKFMHIILDRSGHLVECSHRRAICICQPSFHWSSCICDQCLDNLPFWDVQARSGSHFSPSVCKSDPLFARIHALSAQVMKGWLRLDLVLILGQEAFLDLVEAIEVVSGEGEEPVHGFAFQ